MPRETVEPYDALLVASGGALGAAARHAVSLAVPSPLSTLVVNVAGCLAIGYLLYAYRLDGVSEATRLLAATGFLSSFTTYSAFARDVYSSAPASAVAYVAASYALGFVAVAAGARLAVRAGGGTT